MPISKVAVPADVAEILAGCRKGERAAQHRLYELFGQQVFRLTVRMIGTQDAPDVTQQVFLQLFRKIHQFAGNSKFETWLYRLTVNEALQYLRKRRRQNFLPLPPEPMTQRDQSNERNEQQELLELALARLESELRTVFLLREVEGHSYREIASTLEIPEGTVGSRLNRARSDLQQHLRDLGWEG